MGEKVGFITVLLIFAIGIVPILFSMFDEQVKSSNLMTISNEMQQLVVAEGGITPTVFETAMELQERGVDITMVSRDQDGDSKILPEVGDTVEIQYEYEGYEMSNSVVITKR